MLDRPWHLVSTWSVLSTLLGQTLRSKVTFLRSRRPTHFQLQASKILEFQSRKETDHRIVPFSALSAWEQPSGLPEAGASNHNPSPTPDFPYILLCRCHPTSQENWNRRCGIRGERTLRSVPKCFLLLTWGNAHCHLVTPSCPGPGG